MDKIVSIIVRFLPSEIAYAHCDIPCGVYDPTPLQIAAHTVLRMTSLLGEKAETHDVSRITHVKEEHGERVEGELGTLENDYFKKEHYDANPELSDLIKEAVKLSIETRQHVDLEKANSLVENTLKIAEIFYKTKSVTPVRVPSLYPTKGEIVTYK
jgi:nickel superoxide dismutase